MLSGFELYPRWVPLRCTSSLHRGKRNLASVGNVYQTALRSLFWAPKRLNELPEVRFEFPFQPDWQIGDGIFTCTTDALKD